VTPDGDGKDDAVPKRTRDVPETRKHESKPTLEPPERPSASLLDLAAPPTYPDDGPVSGMLRTVDKYLGVGEQGLLFATLAVVVLVASAHAIIEKATEHGLWWSYDVIRAGTFTVAMIGAAFATHQMRHLAMDLISRRLPPRARLALAAVLEAFTIAIAILLVYSGLHQVGTAGEETGRHLLPSKHVAKFLPLGAGLIAVHAALHLLIDIDYLRRGKLMPERARSGH
jgi:C4-dicarboxylate transporter, DctQ subunit